MRMSNSNLVSYGNLQAVLRTRSFGPRAKQQQPLRPHRPRLRERLKEPLKVRRLDEARRKIPRAVRLLPLDVQFGQASDLVVERIRPGASAVH